MPISIKGALAVSLLASTAWSAAAHAQAAPADSGAAPTTARSGAATPATDAPSVQEVVVTARKRSESVEKAPLTIAVVSAQKLKTIDVVNPNELNGTVPGLVMMPANGGIPAISFRGLGSNSALFSVESSVALFVDGVYYAHPRDYVTPMYDLDHLEMVKGTQGTLLGKNTTLGAITMVTNRPKSTFGYSLDTSYEFETHTPKVQGYVNVPLTENFWVRASGLYSDDGGYIDNAFGGRQPEIRDLSGRLALYWEPTSGVNALLTYQHDDRRGAGQDLQLLRDASAGVTVASIAARIGQTNFEANPDNQTEIASNAFGTAPSRRLPYDEQVSNRVNFIANADLGGRTLTAQSSYTRWGRSSLYDLDYTEANLQGLFDQEQNKEFTQEVRIASPTSQKFSYLAGVFFFKNWWDADRTFFGALPFPSTGSVTNFYHQNDTTLSGFAQFTYNFIDRLSFTGGIRYTDEDKKGTIFRPLGTGKYALAQPPIPTTTLDDHEQSVDGDAGIQYKITPTKMLYVSGSKGSKAGGFQNTPVSVAAMPYKGETAYTIETGGKFVFRGATLDGALFDTIVDGFQFSHAALIGSPPIVQTIIDNSDVRSRGVEVNGSLRVTPDIRLSGGLVYADAIATKNTPAPPATPVQVVGLVQPRAPKWSGNFDAEYRHPLTDKLTFDGLASVEFSSKTYLQPNIGTTLDAPVRNAYAKLELRLAVQSSQGWEVAVLGKNLSDERQPLFTTPVPGTGAGGDTSAYYGNLMRPRTVVLQLTLHR